MDTARVIAIDLGMMNIEIEPNGGNMSVRVAKNLVLCTPTLVSKGFMKPEDLALVDMEGTMVAGRKRRTSELLMHLATFAAQPKAKACVHAHPPNTIPPPQIQELLAIKRTLGIPDPRIFKS